MSLINRAWLAGIASSFHVDCQSIMVAIWEAFLSMIAGWLILLSGAYEGARDKIGAVLSVRHSCGVAALLCCKSSCVVL